MKKENGITMVALVVTIIVLIILAGISINLILGNNGIITIAKKAKENIELAKIEEEKELNELYTQLETNGTSSSGTNYDAIAKLNEFKTAIANAIDEAGGVKPEVTAETSVFADNIKGILREVTKNATATADNISEGKTAWVNGELITGIGKSSDYYFYETSVEYGKTYTYKFTKSYQNLIILQSLTHMGQVKLNDVELSVEYKGGNSGGAGIGRSSKSNIQIGDVITFYNRSASSNYMILFAYN